MFGQNLPRSAEQYARSQRQEIEAATAAVRRLWRRMTPDLDSSYGAIEGQFQAVVTTAQGRLSSGALGYVPAVLAETGQSVATFAQASAAPLVGFTGDGRPIEGLLRHGVVRTKGAIGAGQSVGVALLDSNKWLSHAVQTALSDTGRQGESLAMGVRSVGGYVRMLNPPSCSRCAILAGAWYRKNDGFARHPGCFPAGAVVSGPAPEAATRRWYEGELAIVTTASGKKLTATGNHPVLTNQGWVPAGFLQVGDTVLSSALSQGAIPLVIPDEKQRPALIEDVWGADGMVPLGKVPTAAEDFHGDGGHGEVDIVLPDRLLGHGEHTSVRDLAAQELLTIGVEPPSGLAGGGPGQQLHLGVRHASDGLMGGLGLSGALLGGHLGSPHASGGGSISDLDSLVEQALAEGVAADAVTATEAVLTLSGLVGGRNLGVGKDAEGPRWDAPAGPLTMESRVAYASRGADLGRRLAGQVSADCVVKVERVQWSGHVYNLTSSEGWYCADGFIVSNCDCRHIPVAESMSGDMLVSPEAYFSSLTEAEQNKVFTAAGAEAIREGAYIDRVVNARRGMNVSQSGRLQADRFGLYTTTEARKALGIRGGGRGRPYVRLMPESISSLAGGNREHYLDLLRQHGYLR